MSFAYLGTLCPARTVMALEHPGLFLLPLFAIERLQIEIDLHTHECLNRKSLLTLSVIMPVIQLFMARSQLNKITPALMKGGMTYPLSPVNHS